MNPGRGSNFIIANEKVSMVQTVKIHLDSMIYQHSRIAQEFVYYIGKFHL